MNVGLLLWRYGHGRGLWHTVLGAGPMLLAGCAVAPRTVPLLLSENDQRLRLPAVITLVVTVALGPSFARGVSDAEWVHRQRLRTLRALHLAIAVCLDAAVAVAVSATARPNRLELEVFANGLALLGLCLMTVTLTPMPPWLVPFTLVATMYVVGSAADTGRAHAWAWLLWTDGLVLKSAIDVLLFVAGTALFLVRPGRVGAAGD